MPARLAVVLTREMVADLLGRLPVKSKERLWDAKVVGLMIEAQAGRPRAGWCFVYRDAGGAQRQIGLGDAATISLPDARAAAKAFAGKCAMNGDPLAEKRRERVEALTVAGAWARFREDRWAAWKPRTRYTYTDFAQRMIEPHLGKLAMVGVTTAMLAKWHRKLTEDHGAVTANRVHSLLRTLFNWWISTDAPGAANPCKGITRNKESRRLLRLSLDDVGHLWLALDDLLAIGPAKAGKRVGESQGQGGKGLREPLPRGISLSQGTLYRLLVVTGCRASEVRTLQWQDVRLDDGLLSLRDSKTGARDVLLPRVGVELLRALGPAKSGPVFRSVGGGQVADIRKAWLRACRVAGIESGVTPHHLRHLLATLVVVAGGSQLDASRVLGHSLGSGSNATSTYLHSDATRARAALENAVGLIMSSVEKARAQRAAKGADVVEVASA